MPFSTISYNTFDFLKSTLDNLVKTKILEFYFFVHHKAEDDEGGLKDHFHVFMRPCSTVDTSNLIDKFIEHDINDLEKKPLRCLPFKSSKTDDAILYFIHDKSYLVFKGQQRKFHYSLADIVTSDDDEFNFLYKMIDMSALTPYKKLMDAQEIGMTFNEYFKSNYIPIQQLTHYQQAWNLLIHSETFRKGRKGHDSLDNEYIDYFDSNTGEIILK